MEDTTYPEPSEALESKRAALREQAEALRADAREFGRLSKEAAREEYERARQAGHEVMHGARDRYDSLEESLVESVRENPLRSLAYAAGVGLVLGILARRG